NNYVNVATGNYRINGNVMTVDMGDWAGGTNQQGLVTVRILVNRNSVLPAFACTGLSRTFIDNNHSTFTASSNGAAAGANISSYHHYDHNCRARRQSGRYPEHRGRRRSWYIHWRQYAGCCRALRIPPLPTPLILWINHCRNSRNMLVFKQLFEHRD